MARATVNPETSGKITIVLESEEHQYDFEPLGLSFENSTDQQILEAVAPLVLEESGINIKEDFIVRKVEASQSVLIFPKSTAGY